MSQVEALHYFTPFELCNLVGEHRNCKEKYPGKLMNKKDNNNMCNMGWQTVVHQDKSCASSAGFLMRYHTLMPWPKSASVVDLSKHMHERGSNTVILLGDSVCGQMLADGMCAFERSGGDTHHFFWNATLRYPGFTDGWKVDFENNPTGPPFFQMLLYSFAPGGPRDAIDQLLQFQTHLHEKKTFETVRGGIVFVINHGLHCNEPPSEKGVTGGYSDTINATMRYLLESTRPEDTIIFRETSAQHFNTPTGLFDPQISVFPSLESALSGKPNATPVAFVSQVAVRSGVKALYGTVTDTSSTSRDEVVLPALVDKTFDYLCQPIANESMMHRQNWKNIAAKKVISQLDPNITRIFIAPFFKETASRHDLHPRDLGDCTHYCSAPMLWAPLWHSIVHIYHRRHRIPVTAGKGRRAR